MIREIVLDTETTGLDPNDGHRVIEIGCVELINQVPSGKVFHAYVNPERDVPPEASAVSGLTTDFLKPHPVFSKVVEDFLNFIQQDILVIHNAKFDIKFLNAELTRLNIENIPISRAIDTVALARKKFPGSPASLDALCKRFKIDLSSREKHGALIDSQLLAQVYLELLGGRQRSLVINKVEEDADNNLFFDASVVSQVIHPFRTFNINQEELEKHKVFIQGIKNSLWEKVSQAG